MTDKKFISDEELFGEEEQEPTEDIIGAENPEEPTGNDDVESMKQQGSIHDKALSSTQRCIAILNGNDYKAKLQIEGIVRLGGKPETIKGKLNFKDKFLRITPFEVEMITTFNGKVTSEIKVSDARIKKISKIKLKLINEKITGVSYKLDFDDREPLISDAKEIGKAMEQHGFYVNKKYERELTALANESYSAIEEMYYAPGWWLTEQGKILAVKEAGYSTPWKEIINWNPPLNIDTDTNIEEKRKTLQKLTTFVNHYGTPSKASAVLSFGVLAPLCVNLKQMLNYFCHCIIHGLQGTGKSTLLDYLKLLYSVTWADAPTKGDFQTRRMLAQTTIPAIVDEMRIMFQITNSNNTSDALEMLHTSATTLKLRNAGTQAYGGLFLAVRTVIGATNEDLNLLPFQADKLIVVSFKKGEGLASKKGADDRCTPRTLPDECKKMLPILFVEMLEELAKDIKEQLPTLKLKQREVIPQELVNLGYNVWKKIYKKYDVENFPEPYNVNNEVDSQDPTPQIIDDFKAYLKARIDNNSLGSQKEWKENLTETVRANWDLFEKTQVLYVFDKDTFKYKLICMPSFLSKAVTTIAKQLPDDHPIKNIGWRSYADMLGGKQTTANTPTRKSHVLVVIEDIHEIA